MTISDGFEHNPEFVELAKARPLLARIIRAFNQRADLVLGNMHDPAKCAELGEQARELASWFDTGKPAMPVLPEADRYETAKELERLGWPSDLIVFYLDVKPKAALGRRHSNRNTIRDALEYKEQHPSASWQMLTNHFCQCGAPSHGEKCRQLIRTRINGLKKTLNKLGV